MTNSSPSGNLERAVRLAGIRPKHGLGQNFLVDDASLDLVVAAAKLTSEDTVLEVGPGLGFLTAKLCNLAKQVTAVETDEQLAEILGQDPPANLTIVTGDIMDFNLSTLPPGYKVVANIPYYLTSKLLRALLESPHPPQVLSILVQKEVAERITAMPGQLSILALSVQYYAHAKIVGVVERHKFWPQPKVDSAVLAITRRPKPAFAADPVKLFRLIKAGFGERRKQLRNSLAGGLNMSTQAVEALLAGSEIDATKRAQELDLIDWQRLYRVATKDQLL